MSRLNIGFIGCGRISEKHFNALDLLREQIGIQALCDIDIERARAARTRSCNENARVYGNITSMLAQENSLNAVVIALPNGLHAQAGLECARRGLHIIMEKPLAVHLADGRQLVECCQSHKVELFLIHQNRFNLPVQRLYKAILNNRLGRIYSIYANVFWQRPQSYYDCEAAWHGSKEMDGGGFYTQASHYIDMVQWLAGGPPQRLCAQLRTLARNIETEDCGAALLEWGQPGAVDNLIATINMSLLTYPNNLEGSVLVLGEKGTVKIGGTAMNKMENWQVEGQERSEVIEERSEMIIEEQSEIQAAQSYDTDSVYGFGHQNLYAAIAGKLNNREQEPSIEAALISGSNILDNQRILEAIQRSSQEGGRVVPL